MEYSTITLIVLVICSKGLESFGVEGSQVEDDHQTQCEGESRIHVAEPWVHAGIRSTIGLRCKICAEKPYSVWWSKDGDPIHESGRIREIVYHKNLHLLKIKNVRELDFGNYNCNLFLNKTYSSVQATIQVSGVPFPALFEPPNSLSETTFDLAWRVNCSTTAPIISYRLEFRELVDGSSSHGDHWIVVNIPAPRHDVTHSATATTLLPSHFDNESDEILSFHTLEHKRKHGGHKRHIREFTQSYTIRGLSKETQYEARVQSRNAFGVSDYSETLYFQTFDKRHTTTSTAKPTTSTKPSTTENHRQMKIEIVTFTAKPTLVSVATTSLTKMKPSVEEQLNGIDRVASSEPLSTRQNQGYAAFSSGSVLDVSIKALILHLVFIFQRL